MIREVSELLTRTENTLQQLIEKSVVCGDYSAVQRIATVAAKISEIRGPLEQARPESMQPRFKRSSRKKYPEFEMVDDVLVKIGWSKTERREYRHKAPVALVHEVAGMFDDASGQGSSFRMEDVLPMNGSSGEEVPAYQVYLVLAWFRNEGFVSRNGRSEYKINDDRSLAEQVLDALASTRGGEA